MQLQSERFLLVEAVVFDAATLADLWGPLSNAFCEQWPVSYLLLFSSRVKDVVPTFPLSIIFQFLCLAFVFLPRFVCLFVCLGACARVRRVVGIREG